MQSSFETIKEMNEEIEKIKRSLINNKKLDWNQKENVKDLLKKQINIRNDTEKQYQNTSSSSTSSLCRGYKKSKTSHVFGQFTDVQSSTECTTKNDSTIATTTSYPCMRSHTISSFGARKDRYVFHI